MQSVLLLVKLLHAMCVTLPVFFFFFSLRIIPSLTKRFDPAVVLPRGLYDSWFPL